jgi:hypothetical protein
MKFVRHYTDLRCHSDFEDNDSGLGLLLEFLENDAYRSIRYYINWLKNSNQSDWITGHLSSLEREDKLIIITDIHDGFNDDSSTEEEQNKCVIDRQRLIQILHQWEEFLAKRDKLSSSILNSKDLLVTQDKEEGVFSVELIDTEDPRFSQFIIDDKPKYTRVEKSEIFDDYLKVTSNDEGLYNLGLILAEYRKKRFKPILLWMQRDYPYDDDDGDKIFNHFELTPLSQDRQGLFLITVWNREKNTRDEAIRFSTEELKNLLNSWLEIADKDPFPKAVFIVKENGKIVLRPEY